MFRIFFTEAFAYSVIRISTPIIFAALGALITSKAAVVNIGLEGIMLCSALAGVIGSAATQSAFVGLLAAVLIGIIVSAVMSYVVFVLQSNITLTGIAINMFGSGATVFVLYLVANDKGISSSLPSCVLPTLSIPFIQNIPLIGPILSGHNVLTYVAFLCTIATHIFIEKTVTGPEFALLVK